MKSSNQLKDKAGSRNKVAALSYLFFGTGLIKKYKTEFTVYHAGQSLNLLIVSLILIVLSLKIQFIGLYFLLPVSLFVIVMWLIIGIRNALLGRYEPLPYIGKYVLIKVKDKTN
ncbi:MAG: hypothetical protein PF588_02530 [Candidatus Kapabacteria bacterium]|nr:hypothetical protein [Candidatus Kapabacteria bacterium]